MAILVDKNTKVLVQGITGREGEFHATQMIAYGTQVVGGVTPGKGGMTVQGVPVFDTVQEAKDATGADATCIFVPARGAADGIMEAVDAGLDFIVCITEGIPIEDEIKAVNVVKYSKSRLLGPNCPGILTVGGAKIGIIPASMFMPGPIGIVSRSGTLTYESVDALTRAGLGQTTCVGVGGDPMPGTRFIDVLPLFEADPETKAVVMCGEVGGLRRRDCCRVHQDHDQARHRLHCGPDRPARQAHGPRRRDHFRHLRQPAGQSRRPA